MYMASPPTSSIQCVRCARSHSSPRRVERRELVMNDTSVSHTVFLTMVRTVRERACTRLLIDSIRSFGGALSQCPVWLFEADPRQAPCEGMASDGVRIIPLDVPDTVRGYHFADKVCACARAEGMVPPEVRSLIWIAPVCLIIKPPLLFDSLVPLLMRKEAKRCL